MNSINPDSLEVTKNVKNFLIVLFLFNIKKIKEND